MSTLWDTYPSDYRAREVQTITAAVQAGECVSVVGLSGAGKSNLLGYLAHRVHPGGPGTRFVLVDCNRLASPGARDFFRLVCHTLQRRGEEPAGTAQPGPSPVDELAAAEQAIERQLELGNCCLLFDRFEALVHLTPSPDQAAIFANLRALRDAHKYALTYVTATRRPLDAFTELSELFYGSLLWLGPLSESDARWTVERYAKRKSLDWDDRTAQALIRISWGYPSFLRAVCEAHASGAHLDPEELAGHPAVHKRIEEFWRDRPSPAEITYSGLAGHPFLAGSSPSQASGPAFDPSQLTAKEHLLLSYFQAHPGQVCEKDDLIRAVWPEDKVFIQGVRDDSLAQLVRRLRKKIEADASEPRHIHTVPGRGYRFIPEKGPQGVDKE